VAHTCNPSYSGGRDQEDRSLKPAWGNSSRNSTSKKKKKNHKRGLVEWLKVQALRLNPSTAKKKKEREIKQIPLATVRNTSVLVSTNRMVNESW
jgi:hypothetical protein